MCPVAEGGFGSLFAATEEGGFAGFRSEFHWRESAAFVRTIAERLFGGLATRAPVIGFALFKVDFIGGGLSDFRDVGHSSIGSNFVDLEDAPWGGWGQASARSKRYK